MCKNKDLVLLVSLVLSSFCHQVKYFTTYEIPQHILFFTTDIQKKK